MTFYRFFILANFFLIALNAIDAKPLSSNVGKLDENVGGTTFVNSQPWKPRNNHFYDVIRQTSSYDDDSHSRRNVIIGSSSNRHRRDASIVSEEDNIVESSPEFKPENLLVQARKLIDPEILEGIDLNDPEQYQQLVSLIEKKQAEKAYYSFAYAIQDEISDSFSDRQEERDGLTVRGYYSYGDGNTRTKVSYIADENGYRVTSIETEPIEGGPKPKKYGTAMVQQVVSGVSTKYAIQAQPKNQTETEDQENAESRQAVELVDITSDFLDTDYSQ